MTKEYSAISVDSLPAWNKEIENDRNSQLGGAVLRTYNADEALIDRDTLLKNANVFNTAVETEGSPRTNQKASGRCWLFAATNVLRLEIMKKFDLKEFQFSQSYLFFYDKFEKANYFLEQFYENIQKESLDSRIVQYLLTSPVSDGGQFDMFINIVEKYGLIPHDLYPDVYSSTASRTLNFILTSKLREFAEDLQRAYEAGKDIAGMKQSMQQEIYRLLVIFFGKPPLPHESLHWDYKDKNGTVSSIDFSPLSFYKETLGKDLSSYVSLLNDPRNKYDHNIKVDGLGNSVNGKTVEYLNMESDDLAHYAINQIKNNKAVFFGAHSPIFMDKKRGIMDEKLYKYDLVGINLKQEKASRIAYKQSLMTHAMIFTAVHLDSKGKPLRWKVENSWGKDSGQEGYYVMDHEYFKQYVYQIVCDKSELSTKHKEILKDDSKTTILPIWDPMGALATFESLSILETPPLPAL